LMKENGFQNLEAFTQNHKSYNEPITRFTHELSEGRVSHGGDPLLSWQAGNLVVKKNALGLVMPEKGDAKYKIDSMVALFMAFSAAMFSDAGPSVYETRGVLKV